MNAFQAGKKMPQEVSILLQNAKSLIISEAALEKWPLITFASTAMICLGCSTAYHLFMNMSQRMADRLRAFDLGSISFLIGGSQLSVFYYQVVCETSNGVTFFGFDTLTSASPQLA